MRLPATSAPLTFLISPYRKGILFNQFAYPALQVQSVMNAATMLPVIQNTGTNQPVWSQNALAGPYVATNAPGSPGVNNAAAGIPGFVFSGSQYFEYDTLASSYSTPESALTVVCQVAPATSGGTVWSFADATDGYSLSLSYSGGNLVLAETNVHGTFSTSYAVTHGTLHVVTAIRSNNVLSLRVDGSQVGTAAVTAGTVVPTTFVVGALNSGGSVSSEFNGTLGSLAVYTGSADIYSVETFMLLEPGIILGPSSGINSGF
jgi:hypothetical protein